MTLQRRWQQCCLRRRVARRRGASRNKNRRYAARITWPRGPGVYWVEVLYHGLPVGPAYELEVLEEGHSSMQNFSKRTSEVWQGVEDDELDIDKLEIDLDQIAKEELDSSDSEVRIIQIENIY